MSDAENLEAVIWQILRKYKVAIDTERCPATTKYVRPWTTTITGIQCQHDRGHDGDHAGYAGYGYGDVFWPQEDSHD